MALSQAYLECERLAKQKTITSILSTRFGALDAELEAIVPALLELPIETAMPLLLQRSREELLQQFAQSPGRNE